MISEHVMRMTTSSSSSSNFSAPRAFQQSQQQGGQAEEEGARDVPLTLTQRLRRSVALVDESCYLPGGGRSGAGHAPPSALLQCAALKALATPELLRHYLSYARQHCHPSLSIPAAKVSE